MDAIKYLGEVIFHSIPYTTLNIHGTVYIKSLILVIKNIIFITEVFIKTITLINFSINT